MYVYCMSLYSYDNIIVYYMIYQYDTTKYDIIIDIISIVVYITLLAF